MAAKKKSAEKAQCRLCKRMTHLTFHHLIPRKMHRRTYFKKHYSRETLNDGIDLCHQCHSGIHKLYDEMQLARVFNTVEALLDDPAVSRHVAWVARQAIS